MSACSHGLEQGTCAVCKYGPDTPDGYVPVVEPDYAFEARKHTVRTHRTRKGRTVQEVTKFGAARVVGAVDVDANGRPLLAELGPDVNHLDPSSVAARLLAVALERGEIRRGRLGISTIDLDRITREAYGDLLPPVAGSTEVRQYEQVIHKDRGARGVNTAHTCGLDGGSTVELSDLWITGYVDRYGAQTSRVVRDATIGEILAPRVACVSHTSDDDELPNYIPDAPTDSKPTWQTRGTYGVTKFGRLPYDPRQSDPKPCRVFRVASDGTCERVALAVVAGADPDHVWFGHQLVTRTAPIVRTTDALEARTTITADDVPDLPTDEQAWAELLGALDVGKRADLGLVTVTTTAKWWRATDRRGPETRSIARRTAQGLAHALAT